jgi:hypothetical protein
MQCAVFLRPLFPGGFPLFQSILRFEKRAYTTNPRLIIPPTDKIAVVYFPAARGTNFNSLHIFVTGSYHEYVQSQ